MEPSMLLLLLAILICPISMGIMMWKMNKNMDDHHTEVKPGRSAHPEQIKKMEARDA